MLYKDQLNRTLRVNKTPKRIVCLVPSLSELIIDLGLEEALVGVTKFCVHPKHLTKKCDVIGGTKQVHFDKIEALRPDIIICNKEENTQEIVEKCSVIAPVWVSDIATLDQNNEMILMLGRLFDKVKNAKRIVSEIKREELKFKDFIQDIPIKSVAYLIWKNPYMAVGKGTFIDYLLKLNKFENIILKNRYPEVNLDDLKNTSHILLSSEPYPFKEKDIIEIKKGLPENMKVLLVNGEYFSWYGSRMRLAFQYFKTLH